MDFKRGERVNLNFDSGNVEKLDQDQDQDQDQSHDQPQQEQAKSSWSATSFMMSDILERDSSATNFNPPAPPSLKSSVNGFPAHRKRIPRVSVFQQQRLAREQEAAAAANTATQKQQLAPKSSRFNVDEERRAIDEENKRKLASMSDREIEAEREELLSSLSPALIQKLLMRSNLDEGSNERDLYPELKEERRAKKTGDGDVEMKERDDAKKSEKKVQFAEEEQSLKEKPPLDQQGSVPPAHTQQNTSDIQSTSTSAHNDPSNPNPESIHFPPTPQPPDDLNPNSPTFLQSLHEKYFPNLPYDPSSLSWMTPIDANDTASPYHPSHTHLNPSELRFDFKGNLLPPSVAREIPTDQGLHHHADAPEAAGYTIPELAVTARSAVAAQRCVAYQTLGRILFRLGKGEFGVERGRQRTDGAPVDVAVNPDEEEEEEEEEEGDEEEDEDVGSAMAAGLWKCVEEGHVIETLTEEANKERGHLTARTFAQEALWNWRRGGGRKRQAV